jgi:predicted DNA-binding transcriptional regulator YafY
MIANAPSRQSRLVQLLRIAMEMAGSREGLSLADIASREGVSHRTAERYLATLKAAFPALEPVAGDGRVPHPAFWTRGCTMRRA